MIDCGTSTFTWVVWFILVASFFSLLIGIGLIVLRVWLFQRGPVERRLSGKDMERWWDGQRSSKQRRPRDTSRNQWPGRSQLRLASLADDLLPAASLRQFSSADQRAVQHMPLFGGLACAGRCVRYDLLLLVIRARRSDCAQLNRA